MLKESVTAVILVAAAMYGAGQTPPQTAAQPPGGGGRQGTPPPGRGGGLGAGPNDLPAVDPAAADRGKRTWAAECINCHGTQARGTDNGPNLLRSVIVLRDRYGNQLGPFLKKGHQTQSGTPSASLTDDQVRDLAHFLRQRVNDTLRGSPIFQPQNVLTGDPTAGAAYFNGDGKCTTCHSTTGNLAGIGGKYAPVDLQQRFLFPGGRGGRGRGAAPAAPNPTAIRVTVTPPNGAPASGVLVQMDDFYVTLRGADGFPQTFRRVAGMTIEKQDPLAFHVELLDRLTDKQMHDIVAYLETVK